MSEHETLAAALVAALADLTVVEKGRTAKIKTSKGPDYSYDYADIADVVKLTRPKLAEHGIVALTPVHDSGSGLGCTVTLLHVSGDRLDFGPFPFPPGRDPQSTGSAVTYHRRYALVAALGLAAGEDDDGHAATQSSRQPEPAPVGITSQELGDRIRSSLTAVGVEDPDGGHAKAIWRKATPKVADDGLIYESEQTRVMSVAADYVAGVEPSEIQDAF